MIDWHKIKAEYIAGGGSYRELADKYGVSFHVLEKKARKEKWADLRRQTGDKVATKICDKVVAKEVKKAITIDDTADMLLEVVSQKIANGEYDMLPQSVRQLTAALKDLKEIKGIKGDRDIREQEARIKKLEKDASTDEANKDIQVVIASDLEKYSE